MTARLEGERPPPVRGRTTIADGVVAKIVRATAEEVKDAGVEVGEREVALDLAIIAPAEQSMLDSAEAVRRRVAVRVESLTGLNVVEVNVTVADLTRPERDGASHDAMPDALVKMRRRRTAHLKRGPIYRAAWVLGGVIVVLAGIVMLLFPGPALLVIPIGLAMLSLEFAWAGKLLETGVRSGMAAREHVGRADRRVLVLGAVAMAAAVAAVVTLAALVLL
jgi:uncharacterized protein (TIGR02611 family)